MAKRIRYSMMPSIFFFTESVAFTLRHKNAVRHWLSACALTERKQVDTINYIFCSDKYLRKINKQYLDHDYYTDIITFSSAASVEMLVPASGSKLKEKKSVSKKQHAVIGGDIYISIDRVKENAKQYEQTVKDELHRVMAHGVLHLCGYGDKSASEEKKMRKMEEKWLSLRDF
jgi:rRNA maturation RNase YbeY